MLSNGFQRGFPEKWLSTVTEPRVHKDQRGHFIFSISENAKVYFEEFYQFLEEIEKKCLVELGVLNFKLNRTSEDHQDTLAYYRARKIVVEQLLKTIYSFYSDDTNLGVIMSPWCFGTVVLEKIEIHKERLMKGEATDPNLPDFPFYVFSYLNEIYKKALLEVLGFPPEAFAMRWQYSELLKRYSKVLSDVNSSLQQILQTVKSRWNGSS
jgi:hypothetical protein